MSIDVAVLRQELEALEAEMRSDPRPAKIEHLRALISLYGDSQQPAPTEASVEEVIKASVKRVVDAGAGSFFLHPKPDDFDRTPKITRIKVALEEALAGGRSAHRKNLLEVLKEKGLMGSEKDPMAAFASNMYQLRDVFESDGRGMFRLRQKDSGPNSTLEKLQSLME